MKLRKGQSFDPIAHVDASYPDLKFMMAPQARKVEDLIVSGDLSRTLELGFAHGKSSAYIAAILKSLGRGSHVTVDRLSAERREPNIHQVLEKLGLTDLVTIYVEQQSYTWRLMKMLESGQRFDFCYLDGGHIWDATGFAFYLVDQMLEPGGVIVLDDLDWTVERSLPPEHWPKAEANYVREYVSTPQVRKVFELIAKRMPNYECEEWKRWGIARKKKSAADGKAA